MKKLILLFCLTISITAKSQIILEVGTGFTTKATPSLQLGVKGYISDYFVQVGYLSHLSSKVNNGTLFNMTSGIDFQLTKKIKASPAIGYFYHLRNTDNITANTHGVMAAQYFSAKLNNCTRIFLNVAVAENTGFFVMGVSSNVKEKKNVKQKVETFKF